MAAKYFTDYKVTEIPAPGLLIVSSGYGQQLWALCSRPGYKAHSCAMCGREVAPRQERMYRPTGNPMNRMKRLCQLCVEVKN